MAKKNNPNKNKKPNQGRSSNNKPDSRKPSNTKPDGSGSSESNGKDGLDGKPEGTPSEEKARNDVAWYAKDTQLIADASRINFTKPFGHDMVGHIFTKDVSLGDVTVETIQVANNRGYAGVATYEICPSVGYAHDRNDPINVAANMLYTHVRYVNSGRKNYDPADLMIYVCTVAELYSFIAFCQKVYNLAFMYSQRNFYFNATLLRELGIDPEELCGNLASFRTWLNTFINKVSAYAIPADITYFPLKIQMYGSLYIENSDGNIKDQLYQVRPGYFYRFTLDDNNAGMLTLKRFAAGNSLMSTTDLRNFGEDLLAPIWADEDFGLISGDIIKAFEGRLVGLTSQPDEGFLEPVFDFDMLMKFHNATPINVNPDFKQGGYYNNRIMQDGNGNLHCEQYATFELSDEQSEGGKFYDLDDASTFLETLDERIIDIDAADVDPGKIIEATRWMVAVTGSRIVTDDASSTLRGVRIKTGTEIVMNIRLVNLEDNVGNENDPIPFQKYQASVVVGEDLWWLTNKIQNPPSGSEVDRMRAYPSTFKYVPLQVCVDFQYLPSHTWDIRFKQVQGMLSNYTNVTDDILARLHEVCLLSLYSVPGVAKFVLNANRQ